MTEEIAQELLTNARMVLKGFGAQVFVRNIDDDHEPGWAINLLPYVNALARLEVAIQKADGLYPCLRPQEDR